MRLKTFKIFLYILLIAGSIPFIIPLYQLVKGALTERERIFVFPPDPVPVQVRHYAQINGEWTDVRIIALPGDPAVTDPDNIGKYGVKRKDNEDFCWVVPSDFREDKKIRLRWENFSDAWSKAHFGRYILNTLFITLSVVLGSVLSCSLVGYAFARLRFKGKKLLFMILLATLMLPAQITMIPTFIIFKFLGWIDTFKPLIVPAWFATNAFFVFLFRQYFLTIPNDLEEAARIDGCSPLSVYWHIMLPVSKPVIVTVAVYSFMWTWNDLLNPLIYINSDHKRTLALGLAEFMKTFYYLEPTLLLAVTLLMIIPVILLFFFAQKALMKGMLVSSGLKG